MPPGMLQQMQRQLRSGGGMQEMMQAMMQGQGDQFDMEEMQSRFQFIDEPGITYFPAGVMSQMGSGLGALGRLPGMGGNMPNMADMFKMMGMGGGAGR